MALSDELADAVSKLVPGGRRAARVSAVLSVIYSVELEDGTRIAMAPSKPGSRETLQLAAAACASPACRGCGKTDGDDFHQSEIDGAWFCGTCLRGVDAYRAHEAAARAIDEIAKYVEGEAKMWAETRPDRANVLEELAVDIRTTAWEVG